MEIILMERVAKLGSVGDVVTVKNGYARNFLIPQGKAKELQESIEDFKKIKDEIEKKKKSFILRQHNNQSSLRIYLLRLVKKQVLMENYLAQ